MVKMSITKMSSKGQIVIPVEMRKDIKEGEELLIIKDENRIILQRVKKVTEKLREDLEFAKRTEEAWQRIEKGQGVQMGFDEFISEMKKW